MGRSNLTLRAKPSRVCLQKLDAWAAAKSKLSL